jgi:hypothetical protein
MGRFRFDRVKSGEYPCKVRGPDGSEAEDTVTVPGEIVNLTLGGNGKKPARTAAKSKR